MTNRQRNLGINIRVTPEEKKKIERNARKCRLNVSEYLRQIAMKVVPRELPAKEIEESFLRIVGSIFKAAFPPSVTPCLPAILPARLRTLAVRTARLVLKSIQVFPSFYIAKQILYIFRPV